MQQILLKNCNLIPVDPKKPNVINNIDILISEGKIKNIAKNIKAKDAKIIDCTNKYITPGFINCHTHIPMSLFRELPGNYKLQDWLNKLIWPLENKLTPNDIYWFSLLSMCESLVNGVTTVNDMYFGTTSIIRAKEKSLINLFTTVALMDIDGPEGGKRRWNGFQAIRKKYPNENIILSIHALNTASPAYLKSITKMYKDYKTNLLHIHFCENVQEKKEICQKHNVTVPATVLEKYFKNFKLILGHGVILTNDDIKILKNLDCSIAHDPVSNLRLGSGVCDIVKLTKNNINVCLGTDGQGSGSNLSILKEMRLACLLPKGLKNDPTVIDSIDALRMATINGAKALGVEKTKGSITIGKDADLVVFNLNSLFTSPINDPIANIVHNANNSNIETVIVNGKIVVNNSKHVNINHQQLISKCQTLANNLKKR